MKIFLFILLSIAIFGCKSTNNSEKIVYSTKSDSALFYYQKGWKEIMDYGQYGKAEITYRKALSFDPNFLVGQSVLARLTLDLEERKNIYHLIDSKKTTVTGDERLILDIYLALVNYTNLRDQKSPKANEVLNEVIAKANENLQKIIHKYPDEIYLKAEYIEFINSAYGSEQALDSIDVLLTSDQITNPFILGYKATLQAETGQYEEALKNANKLDTLLTNLAIPKPDAILADIYFKMGQLKNAQIHANKATKLDPRNLDASRLKTKIDAAIDSINTQ